MPISEFQVVILAAGKGSRYTDLTSKQSKCLLPIGSKPMIYYPLQLLERNGFQEVFIIINENIKSEITLAIENTGLNITPNLLSIPSGEDWGTAESLKYFSEYFKSDLIILSCDLITNIDLNKVLNLYRKNNASLTTCMFPYTSPGALTVPGIKSKNKIEKDIIGVNSTTNQLLLLASVSDYEETFPLNLNILKKNNNIKLYSKLLDSHLYIIKHWIINYLNNEENNILTIKGELLPHIINKQNSKKNYYNNNSQLNNSITNNDKNKYNIYNYAKESDLTLKINNMSVYNNNIKDIYNNNIIKCFTYISNNDEYALRINTLYNYYKINKEIINLYKDITKTNNIQISPLAEIHSTQLDNNTCIIGDYTKIEEKTSIKNSNINNKCIIKNKTRILDCIIMSGVSIGENCVLTNCIVCNDVVVNDNSNIKDSIVGTNYIVQKNSNYVQQVLTDGDRLMEI